MRNLFESLVNWFAALAASFGSAPHPIVATVPIRPQQRRR
ncbi:hypothetical protein J2X49_002341 [Agrococcus sp. BE272]|nr:hypothetical protein [Agrococcus sp. BE272]